MNLQQHCGIEGGFVNMNHGALDDIGGTALNGRIDGGALTELTLRYRFGVNVGDVNASAKKGRDITLAARLVNGLVHDRF